MLIASISSLVYGSCRANNYFHCNFAAVGKNDSTNSELVDNYAIIARKKIYFFFKGGDCDVN